MSESVDPRFLALLVHRQLLSRETVAAAVASGDPVAFLIDQGHVDAQAWQEWIDTEAGLRPKLSRYELGDALGTGGTARVFHATDRRTGEAVALKVLLPELVSDRKAVQKFIAECKMLGQLDSPNIVRGQRVAREGNTFYSAMEVIDGECLQNRVQGGEVLDEETALSVVLQVAKALSHLHGKGLVHRDVKPGNIMLTADGRAVLIDLGFAVAVASEDQEEASETTAGTVQYISPEQARGSGGLDVRADIYSLGATLYHLVTGEVPFAGRSPDEIMAKQVREALSGQAIRDRDLSPQVHYFIEKMMAKEREIRFQSPDQLAGEVERHLANVEHQREVERDAQPTRARRRVLGSRGRDAESDRDRERRRRRRRR